MDRAQHDDHMVVAPPCFGSRIYAGEHELRRRKATLDTGSKQSEREDGRGSRRTDSSPRARWGGWGSTAWPGAVVFGGDVRRSRRSSGSISATRRRPCLRVLARRTRVTVRGQDGGGELGQPAGIRGGSCAHVGEKQRNEMGKKKNRRASYKQMVFCPGWWLQPGLKGHTSLLESPTGMYTPLFSYFGLSPRGARRGPLVPLDGSKPDV